MTIDLVNGDQIEGVRMSTLDLFQELGEIKEMSTALGQERLDDFGPVAGDGHAGALNGKLGVEVLLDFRVGKAGKEPLGEGGLLIGGEVKELGGGRGFGHRGEFDITDFRFQRVGNSKREIRNSKESEQSFPAGLAALPI